MFSKYLACLVLAGATCVFGQDARPRIDVQHYLIEAEISPETQTLRATTQVRFVPMEDNLRSAVFELNNALNVAKVEDGSGRELSASRNRQDFTVRVSFAEALRQDIPATITFFYDGRLSGREESPVFGLRFASIQDSHAYLMYPARWFPVSGYTSDRFTAETRVTVPAGYRVIGSGNSNANTLEDGRLAYRFEFTQPSFPGSIAVVDERPERVDSQGVTTAVHFRERDQSTVAAYGNEVGKIMTFFSSQFGLAPQANVALVETEDGAPLGYSAPGIVFLAPSAIREEPSIRALANQLSQQWWGTLVSAESRDHVWLVNGLARYAELMYVKETAGNAAFEGELRQAYIDALTIDDIPVLQAARYEDYSPEFWALTGSKGAAVLHMLRYVMGEENFLKLLKQFPDEYAWRSAATADFRQVAEAVHGQALDYFFIQWIQSIGAPEFQLEYTVFRTRQGFRIMGKVAQDLDTFRMPVELKIHTEGNPEQQQVEVYGTSSEFVVETFGKPLRVELDPDRELLRYDNTIRVAVAIRRGEQFAEIGEFNEALKEYQKALEVNRNSSLAHYRIAEIFFLQNNYQSAANEFREVLNGDLDPVWTEVWAHINLGKIFDITNQRERAVNEYNQAIRTKDNTQGAQEEAARYLKEPYQREGSRV